MNGWHWKKPEMLRRSNNHGQGVRHHTDKPGEDMKVAVKVSRDITDRANRVVTTNMLEIRLEAAVNSKAAAFRRRNVVNETVLNRREEQRVRAMYGYSNVVRSVRMAA